MHIVRVKTNRRTQLVDVTQEIEQLVAESGTKEGVCHLYVPHTTAAVMINEHADPDVASDLEGVFDRLVPYKGPYKHAGREHRFACQGRHGWSKSDDLHRTRETRPGHLAGNIFL